ncbi:MAG TPA: ATP-binding cassette domain-containing protein, partial [Candidatus Baltobacteraceae bacterium]|nr:ATP-binding cassette domain-containing protein [Candidatus Baltobacteraceae bacterium]
MNARLSAERRGLPLLAALAVIFGIIAISKPTYAQAGTYAAIDAFAAIGLSLLVGNLNQISVGQAGFFGIGAYTVALLTTQTPLPFPLALALGTLAAGLIGCILGLIALRFRAHYLAMATLAFGLIVVGLFHGSKLFGGAIGIDDVPTPRAGWLSFSGMTAYWIVWVLALAAAWLTFNILSGPTGRAFEAIRNDELAAETLGVPTRRHKVSAFSYAGALAGLGGGLYAGFLGIVVPDAVGVALSIDFLLMAVLGGAGTVCGALVGAAFIGFLDVAGHQFENWREVAYGALVIAVVVAAPGGLFGWFVRRSRAAAIAPTGGGALERRASSPQPGPDATLSAKNVTVRFGGLVAVNDVSFALKPRTLTSLIGPNGAGKTTLFNAVSGIGRLWSGSIAIAGENVTGQQPHRIAARGVGRTFQNARLFSEMTTVENVMVGALRVHPGGFFSDALRLGKSRSDERAAYDRARAILVQLELEPFAATYARDLPFGVRRRVELARALAADPWLLLVD